MRAVYSNFTRLSKICGARDPRIDPLRGRSSDGCRHCWPSWTLKKTLRFSRRERGEARERERESARESPITHKRCCYCFICHRHIITVVMYDDDGEPGISGRRSGSHDPKTGRFWVGRSTPRLYTCGAKVTDVKPPIACVADLVCTSVRWFLVGTNN